ncbi:hypothetical protein BOX15_Mlig000035g4 [Macrostomum lignano]|uniref:Kinesin motor domain-containing protein n=1 Tax=Macrostomum lignano TaxID=282301 RepID=A0A267E7H3_9PLAT|nr:hypothetical protein BOX15_Mlig000035g4 [Macrostomum lignano]
MKIYLRVRPLTEAELAAGEEKHCFTIDGPKSIVANASADAPPAGHLRDSERLSHRFAFSRVFNESVSQSQMFDGTVADLVKQLLQGHSGLVFSYGVTSAGKTHTIQGSGDQPGILPRALKSLFDNIGDRLLSTPAQPGCLFRPDSFSQAVQLSRGDAEAAFKKTKALLQSYEAGEAVATAWCNNSRDSVIFDSRLSSDAAVDSSTTCESDSEVIGDASSVPSSQKRFCVWVSYAEIYNEVVYDLLEPIVQRGRKPSRTALDVRWDKTGKFYIKGLRCLPVCSAQDACRLVLLGKQNQSVAATVLNQQSSRSHSLFAVRLVTCLDKEAPNFGLVSSLTFCDLAGSESQRTARYGANIGANDRAREACSINSSLLTLRRCIETLQHNQQNPKSARLVPFRESKLTQLIQPYFSGSGRATMIVNISRCASLFDDTLNVLRFSALASNITVTAPTPHRLHLAAPNAASPGIGIRKVTATTTTNSNKTSTTVTTATAKSSSHNNSTIIVPVYQTKTMTATVVTAAAMTTVAKKDEQEEIKPIEPIEPIVDEIGDHQEDSDGEDEQQYEVTYVDANEFEMADIAQCSKEEMLKLIGDLRQTVQQQEEEMEEREMRIRRELIAERDRLMSEVEERFEQQLQEQKELQEERHDTRLREYLDTSQRISDNLKKRMVEAHKRKLAELQAKIDRLEEQLGEARSEAEQQDEQLENLNNKVEKLEMELAAAQSVSTKEAIEAEVNIRVRRIGDMHRRLAESADISSLARSHPPPPTNQHRSAMRATLLKNDSFLVHELEAELVEEQENRERQVGAMTATLACSQEMLDGLRMERELLAEELKTARLTVEEQAETISQLRSRIEALGHAEQGSEPAAKSADAIDNEAYTAKNIESDQSCCQMANEHLKEAAKADVDLEERVECLVQKLREEMADSKAKDAKLEEMNEQVLRISSQAEAQLQQLEEQLELELSASMAKDKQIDSLQEKLALLESEAEQKVQLLNQQLLELKDQLESSQSGVDASSKSSDLLNQQLAQLQSQLAEKSRDSDKLSIELNETVEKLRQSEAKLESISAESSAKDEQLLELRRRLDEAESEAENQLKQLRDELVAGQAKLDAKETELNELRQQIANKEAENAEKIHSLEQQLELESVASIEKDQLLIDLKQRLSVNNTDSEERITLLQEQLSADTDTIQAKQNQINELKEQLAQRSKETSQLIQASENRATAAEAEAEVARRNVADLQGRLEVLKRDLEDEKDAYRRKLEERRLESRRNLEAAENNRLAERAKAQRELEAEMAKVASLHLDNAKLQDKIEQLQLPPPPPPPRLSSRASTCSTTSATVKAGTKRQRVRPSRLTRDMIFSSEEDDSTGEMDSVSEMSTPQMSTTPTTGDTAGSSARLLRSQTAARTASSVPSSALTSPTELTSAPQASQQRQSEAAAAPQVPATVPKRPVARLLYDESAYRDSSLIEPVEGVTPPPQVLVSSTSRRGTARLPSGAAALLASSRGGRGGRGGRKKKN